MNTVNKLLQIAENEVGYLEKRTPEYEDDKVKNAGYNNFTKYARDLHNEVGSPFIDGYAWCCSWVTWCFVRAYQKDEALKLLGVWTAYCPTLVNKFMEMGRWYTYPEVGDLIFFYDSEHDFGHVGLVYNVDSLKVYTIEGNTSAEQGVVPNGGAVCKKSYDIDYYRIAGYGRPKYNVAEYGWKKTSKGWRYWKDGEPMRNSWLEYNGEWFYFKANGYMATDEYIRSSSYKVNELFYYVDKDGAWNNKSYKWVKNSKGWKFKCVETGKYVKSRWIVIDNKKYFTNSDGYMVHGRKFNIHGVEYTFNDDGTLKEN